MIEQTFDAITRRAAGAVSRRATVMSLGTAGFAAMAHPIAAEAKNSNKKKSDKKAKKQCKKDLAACTTEATRCAAQVEKCTAVFNAVCGGDPACDDQIACCSELANCDVNAFFACLVVSG